MSQEQRPFWPPGAEITAQAYDAFRAWETRWSEDLEGVECLIQRSAIYSHMDDGIDIDLAKAMAAHEAKNG